MAPSNTDTHGRRRSGPAKGNGGGCHNGRDRSRSPHNKTQKAGGGATAARRLALQTLLRVWVDEAYADRALHGILRRHPDLPTAERAFATELTYGVLRHQIYLDFVLQQRLSGPLRRLPVPVQGALRLGLYQLLHTRVPSHSAVHQSVALIRRSHGRLSGVVNAVLRRLAEAIGETRDDQQHDPTAAPGLPKPEEHHDDPCAGLAIRMSHPTWLLRQVAQRRGIDAAQAWAQANNAPAPLVIRANVRRSNTAQLTALFERDQIQVSGGEEQVSEGGAAAAEPPPLKQAREVTLALKAPGNIPDLPGFAEGLFTVQDPAATAVGFLLDPQPGETILDLCAAPGGKTTHLAELMDDTGKLVACDRHPGKLGLVAVAAERLGLASIVTQPADSTSREEIQAVLKSCGCGPQADRILLDAPCSGFGTLRQHPELRHRKASCVESLVETQRALLRTAAQSLCPGGTLVYSVCTVTQAEGPQQVAAFLAEHPDFKLVQTIETWPDLHGTDGFYGAKLVRSTDGPQPH